MPIAGINHINIRTDDVARSVAFYVDVLDMEYRRGPVMAGQQGHWLHDSHGDPIIHFRLLECDGNSTGPIDHIALTCTDHATVVARLEERGIPFASAAGLLPGVTQLFLRDPHGISLELNFVDA